MQQGVMASDLAITKQIIELHSGTITAKGTEDSRIEFRIELPNGS